MSEIAVYDPILARLKAELTALYGPRLKQVLLYGSRARGDFREDSDYDVLVVLEPPLDFWAEVHRLSKISSQLTWDAIEREHPVYVSLRPSTPEQIQARTGFMHNVRNDAMELTGTGMTPVRPRRFQTRALQRENGTMSPEAVDYLAKAERFLSLAQRGLKFAMHESAARDAYLCALNAARAIVFDKTGVASKTHSGTRSQFYHVIEQGLRFDPQLGDFLREAFEIKQRVDYELVPEDIDHETAVSFVERAGKFLAMANAALKHNS
jgi:uncharacterized protein